MRILGSSSAGLSLGGVGSLWHCTHLKWLTVMERFDRTQFSVERRGFDAYVYVGLNITSRLFFQEPSLVVLQYSGEFESLRIAYRASIRLVEKYPYWWCCRFAGQVYLR